MAQSKKTKESRKPAKSAGAQTKSAKRRKTQVGEEELSGVAGGSPRDAASGLPTGQRQ
jgi:hypothetical protein